ASRQHHDADRVVRREIVLLRNLFDLDRQYPGLRFRIIDEQDRIRPHIRIYLRDRFVFDLAEPVAEDGEVHIIAALSGG
ncbi:MAG TPA: hypothetical protein PLF26_05230, partial [Blastocatellia bacterium]|nr:hypothetical protein [Blastocatellia bacterium]